MINRCQPYWIDDEREMIFAELGACADLQDELNLDVPEMDRPETLADERPVPWATLAFVLGVVLGFWAGSR